MSTHSVFAFSASPRWIACPGSMAFPENTAEGGSSIYADKGTAKHTLSATCLTSGSKAAAFIGHQIKVGKNVFEVDEEFAEHVQTYVDDVERRALGGHLLVEQRVDLREQAGFDESNYGTSDAVIALPERNQGIIEDAKFGVGEKVYAWERALPGAPFIIEVYTDDEMDAPEGVVPNYQLMMYALASLPLLGLYMDGVKRIQLVINQPPLGHISELWVTIEQLERFSVFAADALRQANFALGAGPEYARAHRLFNPGEKQCRWCRAMAVCPALAKKVAADVRADFDTIVAQPPLQPANTDQLSKAMMAVPLISDWCRAVMAKGHEMVAAGEKIEGVDGQPYKFVEGKRGARAWTNEVQAEAALLGQLSQEKVYKPKQIITASAAAKILDKKKTEAIWNDLFKPLIAQPPGKPQLVLGSDARPAYSPAAGASEFDEIGADE